MLALLCALAFAPLPLSLFLWLILSLLSPLLLPLLVSLFFSPFRPLFPVPLPRSPLTHGASTRHHTWCICTLATSYGGENSFQRSRTALNSPFSTVN
ncbi:MULTISPECIES: hypothetical protein [Streptomyces]|uniref:Secreted peptide n=1 Tax=Streptomyces cremeus TaxID=66881 RepID=A0ABV5PFG0_STRCM